MFDIQELLLILLGRIIAWQHYILKDLQRTGYDIWDFL